MGHNPDSTRDRTRGVILVDLDTLASITKPRPIPRPQLHPQSQPHPQSERRTDNRVSVRIQDATAFRPGSTSNCGGLRHSRHRRHSSTANSATRSSSRSKPTATAEPCFFVGDEDEVENDDGLPPTPIVVVGSDGDIHTFPSLSDRGTSRRPMATAATITLPTRLERSSSLPVERQPQQRPQRPPLRSQRSTRTTKPTTTTTTTKRAKRVTFKNPYAPDAMADHSIAATTAVSVESYDELLFNVGGLYHTLSFLHDADYFDDPADSATDTTSSSDSSSELHDQQLPPQHQHHLERSMQLMIAEFLYRSAVYLGYPPDDHVWVPGFRENKKFSCNDVKRWRRLAHFDWEKEEREFEQQRALSPQQQQQITRARAQSSSSVSSRFSSAGGGAMGLRATVSDWIQRRRRTSTATSTSKELTPSSSSSVAAQRKPLPPLVLHPPPVSPTVDLSRLVEIANSCISYGGFRFSERQIRKLCNVPIKT